MQATSSLSLVITALATTLLAGCDSRKESVVEKSVPAVNDENCMPENIAKIDEAIREKFASACLRRGSFQPSERKAW